jgi:DNA-binding transcriptional MerR regulator/methylmalonyl-CoA mutase cobalamin-binding subunit
MTSPEGPSKEPRYRIGAVAKATGIHPDTLRIWERRYGGPQPARTDAGGRLFSDADIARLRLIKQLVDRGHAIGRIAALADAELRGILAQHEGAAPAVPAAGAALIREQFLTAIEALDMDAAQRLLARASLGLGAPALVDDLVLPILNEVGHRWEGGRLRIVHEHGASSLLRSLLGGMLATYAPAASAARMVVTTPSGELHEFGALLAALLARAAGWNALYLGPNLPAEDMLDAVARTNARAFVLSLVTADAPEVSTELERLCARLPADVTLLAGGSAVARFPVLQTRAVAFRTLTEFQDWLDRHGPSAAR